MWVCPGFAQWKDILQLMLACEKAPLLTRTNLYIQFLAALHTQLQHSLGQARPSLKSIPLDPTPLVYTPPLNISSTSLQHPSTL